MTLYIVYIYMYVYLDDVVRGAYSNAVTIRMEGHSIDKPEERVVRRRVEGGE